MAETTTFDAVVIGAGINGIHQLYRLREAGLSVITLEAGSGVGGTWHWNRYPGARLDSECYSYTYHFSRELIEEWDWEEEFADQPKLEAYFNYVVDRFDLRESIVFGARVVSTVWDEARRIWELQTQDGHRYDARVVVAATGILSRPFVPDFEGIEDFQGEIIHTARWPEQPPELAGKRVGVIGVGSTGIQVIQSIAPEVAHLTVFQRTPNWAKPLNNSRFTPARVREVKDRADEYYAASLASRTCFLHVNRPESSTWDVPESERAAIYEDLYRGPGMSLYQGGFRDLLTDLEANREVTDFLSRKIRERVKDPETARKLIPQHPFATKRPPLETGYYEVYNQDNVDLVHLPEEPIVRFTPTGIDTNARTIDLDVVIVATGFDAITGSYLELGMRGVDGLSLADWWAAGPRTYFGVLVHHFPNLVIVGGPQGVNGNQPRCTEYVVGWVTRLLEHMREHGLDRLEVDEEAEAAWVAHCASFVTGTLLETANSWAWGSNVPGKARAYTMYLGPQPDLREQMGEVERSGYAGIRLDSTAAPVGADH